ncbi:hypothetical protein GLYMA_04G234400v4 [Glycine max]|uniref:Uncharacterized protein n=1 Tax=Glycine max TaxID=3847 RepID=A0A0R0KBS7_SOYBN|nr:uncharacterized protein LOC100805767 isoform X2 [Glycine max]XP_040870980.1 uncharacterized protein LOC100805767 isoform X2 [Glycine max]XP_040870981.1 uncharacterized protein LOC100805767 isoform X2 [Glycine max]KAH1112850.1 hypothetical protein GYH30_010870 [Glycine max]KAH1112852.1 hypothetical protein GYH30_010870 [Glycine max]KRH64412.1 hypothetical protein GLYMA_04G234400v4 [Glycine max]KRH64413.1 hypothetical protein GLYMA_04G234400v4 [Glycine max]|eukprot:XP_006578894.1 uncharacterized protein LOC100805767 isoform X2 [Glycine max]
MASAEGKAPYTANCFTQDFRIPPSSPDHPSSVSKTIVSDWVPSNSINDQIHANAVCIPHNLNSDKLPEMKWWLHVKSDLGDEANYTCQQLNSYESELGTFYSEFLNGSVKSGGDQLVKDFDALSNIQSANLSIEQPWHVVSPTCMKNNNTRMPKFEASLNTDLHFTPKKKDQEEFYFQDSHFMDCDISNFLVSEQGKMASSDLESHLMGAEKTGAWWRTTGKDELASLVARKSLEHIENCDLPQPQTKHVSQRPSYPKGVDHDNTPPSSLNRKTETGSSYADSYTTGISTSDCSFQDSNKHSSQSKDFSSSTEGCQINSENGSVSELLKALCHSQTRAREAEKAAQRAYSEKEHILSLFFRQASQLFAYKQWLHMLQLENLCLQLRNKNQSFPNLFPASLPWDPCRGRLLKKSHSKARKRKNSNRRCVITKCAVAFAVGLGLAGAGLLLGWTMGWMFPPL